MLNLNYIIIQAGGKGSRMQILTRNKPKALVPVNNLPMIFHLFRKYPNKKFIVIGDYKYDVLERYLHEFAEDVDYQTVCATGHGGTCGGLSEALTLIPDNERFMLIWCDLVLPEDHEIPDTESNIIGISKDFSCRWMWKDGIFTEERSQEHGVAGYFIFKNKAEINNRGRVKAEAGAEVEAGTEARLTSESGVPAKSWGGGYQTKENLFAGYVIVA